MSLRSSNKRRLTTSSLARSLPGDILRPIRIGKKLIGGTSRFLLAWRYRSPLTSSDQVGLRMLWTNPSRRTLRIRAIPDASRFSFQLVIIVLILALLAFPLYVKPCPGRSPALFSYVHLFYLFLTTRPFIINAKTLTFFSTINVSILLSKCFLLCRTPCHFKQN